MKFFSLFPFLSTVIVISPLHIKVIPFYTGEAGSGKSCTMAKLCVDWVDSKIQTGAQTFELVFLIELKNVDSDIPIDEIILEQHDLDDKNIDKNLVISCLESPHTLLFLDGYDEYKKGTNSTIDRIVSSKRGGCFVLITSRPGDYMEKKDRNKLDVEAQIEGLSDDSIQRCSENYLGSQSQSFTLAVRKADIYELLRVPIILLLLSVVFLENKTLHSSKVEIVWDIIQMYIERAEAKGKELADVDEVLYVLGELSWEAMQRETHQLLIKMVCHHNICMSSNS